MKTSLVKMPPPRGAVSDVVVSSLPVTVEWSSVSVGPPPPKLTFWIPPPSADTLLPVGSGKPDAPFAVPILLHIGREVVPGAAQEMVLELAESELIAEALS